MAKKIKETQGSQKMKQYLEDLKRNKCFRRELNRYIKCLAKENASAKKMSEPDIINSLLNKYFKLGSIARKALKKINKQNSRWKIMEKIAESYALDDGLFSYLYFPIITNEAFGISPNAEIDMCNIVDNFEKHFDSEDGFSEIPFLLRAYEKNRFSVYPISIYIHKFATKRDVLDYVEKKWQEIESGPTCHREKGVRFKKRKYDRKFLDFLWENRDLSAKEIKVKLDKKFPDNTLVYYEIYKLLNTERQRRKTEISVGQ